MRMSMFYTLVSGVSLLVYLFDIPNRNFVLLAGLQCGIAGQILSRLEDNE